MPGRRLNAPAWARVAAVAVMAAAAGCGGDEPDDPVVLALDSRPGPVHAGIFTAVDRDLDARQRVRLQVRTPREPIEGLRLLDSGRADLTVVDIHELGRARGRGQDVVGVGAVVERPMAAVIARADVRRPRALEGKRVGYPGLASQLEVLKTTISADGGDPFATRPKRVGFAGVEALAAGRVDAIVGAAPTDTVALRRRGVAIRTFRLDRGDAPQYPEYVLAAQRSQLDDDPGRVRRAVAAVRAGTRAAIADLPPAARSIHRRAGGDRSLIEAQLRALEPAFTSVPRLRASTLRRWAELDARRGILDEHPDVDRAFALGPAGGNR